MALVIGQSHDCGHGWCVCVDEDPYDRDGLVSVRVQWDDSEDDFDAVTMQHTIGIHPDDEHIYQHMVQTYTDCALSEDQGRSLVQREMERVANNARQQRQSEELYRYRKQQEREHARQQGEEARALYKDALLSGNQKKAAWIIQNWSSHVDYKAALSNGSWEQEG